jgi:hypothetical protein
VTQAVHRHKAWTRSDHERRCRNCGVKISEGESMVALTKVAQGLRGSLCSWCGHTPGLRQVLGLDRLERVLRGRTQVRPLS